MNNKKCHEEFRYENKNTHHFHWNWGEDSAGGEKCWSRMMFRAQFPVSKKSKGKMIPMLSLWVVLRLFAGQGASLLLILVFFLFWCVLSSLLELHHHHIILRSVPTVPIIRVAAPLPASLASPCFTAVRQQREEGGEGKGGPGAAWTRSCLTNDTSHPH